MFETRSLSSEGASKQGLDIGKPYTVVLQYERGSKRTKCLTIEPEENFSLAEMSGEEEGTLGDPRCFIVSAAYGSTFHPSTPPIPPPRKSLSRVWEHLLLLSDCCPAYCAHSL